MPLNHNPLRASASSGICSPGPAGSWRPSGSIWTSKLRFGRGQCYATDASGKAPRSGNRARNYIRNSRSG